MGSSLDQRRRKTRTAVERSEKQEIIKADGGFEGVDLTIGEFRRGVELIRGRYMTSAERLETWLTGVSSGHADRILPVDAVIAERWRRLNVPEPVPVVGGLLAATAMIHGLTLATPDIRDVVETGVSCINPFA